MASCSFKILLYFIIHLWKLEQIHSAVSCVGENGKYVDWFIVYKLPKIKESARRYVTMGLGYAYMDSETKQFTLSDKSIGSNVSAVGYTLQQIYAAANGTGYIMYNDEDPEGHQPLNRGHTKGDLAFDKTSGFWLIHSVPTFPPCATKSYNYPESGEIYGQSFICVTFNYSVFNEIGNQLLYNGPNIYDNFLPEYLASGVPNIQKAIDGKYKYNKPYENVVKLKSAGGTTHTSFAKSKYFESDLYSNLVAPFYDTDLLVETWQNGAGKLPPNCSALTVENVSEIRLAGESFKETKDHSKWTVSKMASEELVCIGDINRMKSQFKRGGGTLCTNNADIWKAFREAVTSFKSCPEFTA
ncbi:plancitoxin-1-like [Dendronephthya gigantea]|uniref:plancitoxin-1-like n=1 Tax=Dendronephthya gigantea TaxID=151771 RepID=UPI00106B34DE|nr:plancitoxin-1-like [Dendronephthya gigantea]